jgi:RHS repeat-associated protein
MAYRRSWFRWQVLLPLAAAASSATVPAAFAADAGGLPYRNPRAEAVAGGGVIESRGWIDQRQDAETGLTYLHARYYDPALGLFVSPDTPNPIEPGVGINRYAYSMGDPINASDRSGNANCVLHQYETVVIDGSYRHSYWDVITVCVQDGGGVSIDRIQNTPRRRRRSSALDATTAAPEIIAAYVSGVGDPVLPPAPAPPIVAPDPAPPALPGPVAPICDKFPQFPGCTGSIDPRPNPCAEAPGLPGCGTPGAPPRPPVVPICAKFPTLPGCDEAGASAVPDPESHVPSPPDSVVPFGAGGVSIPGVAPWGTVIREPRTRHDTSKNAGS